MPKRLSELFHTSKECSEHSCRINRKNVKQIYRPDAKQGFKNKTFVQKILGQEPKICDCIIECSDEKLIVIEILCGKLTARELLDKEKQLKNCCKVIEFIEQHNNIKHIILYYEKKDSKSFAKNFAAKKKLTTPPQICGRKLLYKSGTYSLNIEC